ncbi:MAG: diacylglycerol/polyprenol kinase family protein [Chloroflexota bacterium]
MVTSDLVGAGLLLAYYLGACFLLPTLLKLWRWIPTEVVRKLQHIAYSLSIFLLLHLFSEWYVAIAAAFLLVLLAYPALLLVERFSWYRRVFVDRTRGGELRKQLLYVQLSFALLIFVFWGLLGMRWHYITAVAVMGWGFGDAAAALVGKAWGRRRFLLPLIEGAKTCEGSLAMTLVACLAFFLTLWLYGGRPWPVSLAVALVAAPFAAAVELFSRKGLDTLTVPLSSACLILPLVALLSLLGW